MDFTTNNSISVIVPTIGRPDSLRQLLQSLAEQTCLVAEIIVADGSDSTETEALLADPQWVALGLVIHHLRVQPPNAVRQRQAAIEIAQGELLLFLDDDIVLGLNCIAELIFCMEENIDAVAVVANYNNQSWPQPTVLWKYYIRFILKIPRMDWQGRVIGPLLRFGYNLLPSDPQPMEWIPAGNTLVRRASYIKAGGFSNFFLHRCTMNEDVDLGLKLARLGKILFCPTAMLAHHHAPSGRVPIQIAFEDDIFNRFQILYITLQKNKYSAFFQVFIFVFLESLSNVFGAIRRMKLGNTHLLILGRFNGLVAVFSKFISID